MSASNLFIEKAMIELKRAKRYRVFVSIIIFDLNRYERFPGNNVKVFIEELFPFIKKQIRETDDIYPLKPNRIGLLLPETTRQAATFAMRRITSMMSKRISSLTNKREQHLFSIEMISYPDTAGSRSIENFLMELSQQLVK